jgi:hypothetical protein
VHLTCSQFLAIMKSIIISILYKSWYWHIFPFSLGQYRRKGNVC